MNKWHYIIAAVFPHFTSGVHLMLHKVSEDQRIKEDVMTTGYWFTICIDYAVAWDTCDPDKEDKKQSEFVPDYSCPVPEENENGGENGEDLAQTREDGGESNEIADDCNRKEKEVLCRNDLLHYFASQKSSQTVYVALAKNESFRHEIYDKCHLTLAVLEDFLPFKTTEDEILTTLTGIPGSKNDEFKVTTPDEWKKDKDDDFQFDRELLVNPEAVEIQGTFTEDLDLAFTKDDVRNLFNYETQNYIKVCDVTLRMLKVNPDDSEAASALNTELMELEWNYLTEDEEARKELYHICELDQNISDEDQLLFQASHDKFNQLFT